MIRTEKALEGGVRFVIHPDFKADDIQRQIAREPELLKEICDKISKQHYEMNELVMLRGVIMAQMDTINRLRVNADVYLREENEQLQKHKIDLENRVNELETRLEDIKTMIGDLS